jgi:hypothetical protein
VLGHDVYMSVADAVHVKLRFYFEYRELTETRCPAVSSIGAMTTVETQSWRLTRLQSIAGLNASHFHVLNRDRDRIGGRIGEPKQGCSKGKERLHGVLL